MENTADADAILSEKPVPTDPSAPLYGTTLDGRPKKDGRGRPRKAAQGAPKAEPKPEPDPLGEAPQAAPKADAAGWFSREADAARCKRARRNREALARPARAAIAGGEVALRAVLVRQMARDGWEPADAAQFVGALPKLAEVPAPEFVAGPGKSVADVQAVCLAEIAAYLLPDMPDMDHPLIRSGLGLIASMHAYSAAIQTAIAAEAARRAGPLPADVRVTP